MKRFMLFPNLFTVGVLLLIMLNTSCSHVQHQKQNNDYMTLYEQANHAGNDSEALHYLELAAEQKNPAALARLGDSYLHGRYGLEDPEKAFSLSQEAATAGSSQGMTNLGVLYLKGLGTQKDYESALSWLKKAYTAGDMKAPRYIGLIYEKGLGTPVNYIKAAHFYQQAAAKGDITAQFYLGQCYEKGVGVTQNYQKAFDLYQQSAARGDIISLPAIMALGRLYEKGLGCTKDIDMAVQWYAKGVALGDASAKAKIAALQYPDNPDLMNITAIVKVIGDGQKIAAIALEYTKPINQNSLQITDYAIDNRDITSIYVNDSATVSTTKKTGNFVIVELATTIDKESTTPEAGPQHENDTDMHNRPEGESGQEKPAGFTGPQLGQISDKPAQAVILRAQIVQCGAIATMSGKIIPPTATMLTSNRTVNPDIQGFKQFVYHDDQYDKDLMYNLYLPANYDSTKTYPLVLFMHDAGAVSNNPLETLTQGLGAVIWASKEEQSRNESFVLAPQYNSIIADDNSQTSIDMDVTINLLKSLMSKYSIDTNRIYNTGQSMGGMTAIAMDLKYPHLFAASLLVACQWDPALVAPLANKPLWIIVSQGDNKANPGMDAITAILQKQGAKIAKATWNAEADPKTLELNVKQMLSHNASVNYTVFNGGSHRYTWQYAYSISGIRDWLFKQHKNSQ